MKKVLAIMLSATMVAGLGVPAMAETAEQVPVEAEASEQPQAQTSEQIVTDSDEQDAAETENCQQDVVETETTEQVSDEEEAEVDTDISDSVSEPVSEETTVSSETNATEEAVSFGTDTYEAEILDASTITPVVTGTYNGNKYEVYDSSKSWTDAKAYCESKGGHLVTITSKAENSYVTSLVKKGTRNYYHIGATDASKEGTWVWITGEKFSYKNWDPQRPEPNGGKTQNYAGIIGKNKAPTKQVGEWFDEPNKYTNTDFYAFSHCGFVCEYDSYKASYGTGIYKLNGKYVYYYKGARQFTTDVKCVNGVYYNLVKGVVTAGPTVVKNSSGGWYINSIGQVDFKFTGVAKNSAGWWYIKNGKVQYVTNIVNVNGTYYNLVNGRVTGGPTVVENSSGGWYINSIGQVDFKFTGIAKNSSGSWYCKNGKVQYSYSGTYTANYTQYTITKGKVTTTSTWYWGEMGKTKATQSGNTVTLSGTIKQAPTYDFSSSKKYKSLTSCSFKVNSNTKYYEWEEDNHYQIYQSQFLIGVCTAIHVVNGVAVYVDYSC